MCHRRRFGGGCPGNGRPEWRPALLLCLPSWTRARMSRDRVLGNTPCISNDNLILGPQNAGRYSGVLLDLIVTGERSVTRLTDIDAVLDRVPARLETASGRHELINIETTLRLSL